MGLDFCQQRVRAYIERSSSPLSVCSLWKQTRAEGHVQFLELQRWQAEGLGSIVSMAVRTHSSFIYRKTVAQDKTYPPLGELSSFSGATKINKTVVILSLIHI